MKTKWFKRSLPSFCTSNFEVIRSILLYAKLKNFPVLIECTSNQVNQQGGYTGLEPKEFRKRVKSLSKTINFKKNYLIFGADHLGPLPWKKFSKKKAFLNAKKLLNLTLKENFEKIHLDTTIRCAKEKSLSLDDVRLRFKELFKVIPKKNLKNLYLVAGSEVPLAGGGDIKESISTLNDIKKDYSIYDKIINKSKNVKEFALVIEPGMSFGNFGVIKPSFNKLKKLLKYSKKKNIVFEAHSSDYQKFETLRKLVRHNFKFLKVGPELTYFYHRAIKFMLDIERSSLKPQLRSNLNNKLKKAMNYKTEYWKPYYKGSISKINLLKFNSKLDRIRYYWNNKLVEKSKIKLYKNIENLPEKSIFKKNKINKSELKIFTKNNISTVDKIIYFFLKKTLKKYYKACGFRNV